MKIGQTFFLSFLSPIMILMSVFGLIGKKDNKKIVYLPIGIMGIFLIFEKDVNRALNRRNLFKKIKSFQKVK